MESAKMTKEEMAKQKADVLKGLELSYEKLIAFKKSKNSPLIVSKDGKVVAVSADEVSRKE